jgi:cytochrome oxidase Cu insertion factor (SCO1/SenC/PrrC family)
MRVLLILILVLLVQVNAVAARKRAIQKIFTEGNHTTSNNNLSKTFTLKDLREGKPLVIILKQKNGDK